MKVVMFDEETNVDTLDIVKALERAVGEVVVVKAGDMGVTVRAPDLGLQAHEFGTCLGEPRRFLNVEWLRPKNQRNKRKRRSRKQRGK